MSPDAAQAREPITVLGDIHTHVWDPEHLSEEFVHDLGRAWPEFSISDASCAAHAEHARSARRSVVLAFDASHSGFVVPDAFVAAYVSQNPDRLVGFSSIDPQRPDWKRRLAHAVEELGLRGVKLAPTYQGFDPLSTSAFELYEAIAARNLPVMWHQGVTFVRRSVLAYALPRQIDEVALRFPELFVVIAHMGHPWIDECIAVIRKHPRVYADISALASRPVQFRNALIAATEYRCTDKLLFGTDFPFGRIQDTIEALNRIRSDELVPQDARQAVDEILSRDPIRAIGL